MTISLTPTRALVLGGGGSSGNAWSIGMLAGLADGGVDATDADLVIGTSAGATVAAQIGGATPAELHLDIIDAPASAVSAGGPRVAARPVTNHLDRLTDVIRSSTDAADFRRRLGRATDAGDDGGATSARWRAVVAARLPRTEWPVRRTLITAIDADTGESVVFDSGSGVDLVDAVAASTSNGFGVGAYRLGGRRYLDGGYRTNAENADLAAGAEVVLVLSPFGGRSLQPVEWGNHLATQVSRLRGDGSAVEVVTPGPDEEHLFGANAMDLSIRPAAARAGFVRGSAIAGRLGGFWGRPGHPPIAR